MLKPVSRPDGVVWSTSTASTRAPRRAVPDRGLEPLERFGVAFDVDLDAAVGEVPHPAVKAFARGGGLGEEPEADALHASADQVPPRLPHTKRARDYTAPRRGPPPRLWYHRGLLKRFLVGEPIPSHLAHHERLSRVTGLAVLSSDALSSVAYATDFILATLVVGGRGRVRLRDSDQPRHRVAPRHRRLLVPADDSRLPDRRRRLHRRQGEHRPDGGTGRGRVAPGRLHADRLGQHLGRRARHHVGVSRAPRLPRRAVPRVSGDPDGREPAGHPRIGPHLRGADLCLRRQHRGAAGRRRVPLRDDTASCRSTCPRRRS